MSAPIETVKLQLAMAFGQGAGHMLANHEALNHLLSPGNIGLVERAAADWESSHWAFVELMRLFGQAAANHAAASPSLVIRREDIDALIERVLDLCPCNEFAPRNAPRKAMF